MQHVIHQAACRGADGHPEMDTPQRGARSMEPANRPRAASDTSAVRMFAAASLIGLAGLLPAAARAVPMIEPPPFVDEVQYLEFTIDHHYSALRITELAAGTAAVGSSSNVAGSPDIFPATSAKGTNPVVLETATMANAGQRMEIAEAQGFLRDYYGVDYAPRLRPFGEPLIAALDRAAAGDSFDVAYLEVFSGHHESLLPPSQACTAAAPHEDVRAYCAGIVEMQGREIAEMRTELRETYGVANISYEMVPVDVAYDRVPASGGAAGGTTAVPEPASVALLGAGLLGLGVARGRRKVTFHGVTRGA